MNPVQPWLHDRPARNLNPGDLRPRSGEPAWPGQHAIDHGPGGPFGIFVTAADGWAALGLWCLDARYLRGLRTASEMIAVFAPPGENDTVSYAASVTARMGTAELDLADAMVLEALCKAIAHDEDSRVVWVEAETAAGMRLATARWPAYRAARLEPAPLPLKPEPSRPVVKPVIETADTLNDSELRRITDQPNGETT